MKIPLSRLDTCDALGKRRALLISLDWRLPLRVALFHLPTCVGCAEARARPEVAFALVWPPVPAPVQLQLHFALHLQRQLSVKRFHPSFGFPAGAHFEAVPSPQWLFTRTIPPSLPTADSSSARHRLPSPSRFPPAHSSRTSSAAPSKLLPRFLIVRLLWVLWTVRDARGSLHGKWATRAEHPLSIGRETRAGPAERPLHKTESDREAGRENARER